jgi:SAM-dependent methyltransferase
MTSPCEKLLSFWRHHDAWLADLKEGPSEEYGIMHDLYRGMPAPFNRFFDFWQRRTVQALLRFSPPQPGQRALDLGCGTGRWSRFLQRYGVRTVGIDVGIYALRWACVLYPAGAWAVMALPALGFRDGVFDWVISVTVLQHLPYEDQVHTLREVRRLLSPKGHVVALELCQQQGDKFYLFPRTREGWEELFGQVGFQVLQRQANERLPWIPLLRHLGTWRGGKSRESSLVEEAAALFHRNRWLWIGLYLFLTVAYTLEGLAEIAEWNRWARYMGWLLRRKE